jgi:hypothetical protein
MMTTADPVRKMFSDKEPVLTYPFAGNDSGFRLAAQDIAVAAQQSCCLVDVDDGCHTVPW